MKSIFLFIFLVLLHYIGFTQKIYDKKDLPTYYIQNGDTIGILLSEEQLQKLDNNSELLKMFEKLSIKCDSLDNYYVAVINKMNDKISLLQVKIDKQNDAISKQDGMINNLKNQLINAKTRLDICEQQRTNDSLIIKGLKKDLNKSKLKNIVGWTSTGILSSLAIFLGIFLGIK